MIQYILPAYVGVSSFSGTKIKEAAASFIVSWYFSDYDYFDVFYLKFGHLFYIKKYVKYHIFFVALLNHLSTTEHLIAALLWQLISITAYN